MSPADFGASLHAGALVMFGELHGTMEAPAFVAEVAAAVRGPLTALLPSHVTLVLCGNLHARTEDARWMGWHLRQHHELLSLDLGYDGGAAWNITDADEGIHAVRPRWPGPRGVELQPLDGFDGVYRVGTLTPWEPLR